MKNEKDADREMAVADIARKHLDLDSIDVDGDETFPDDFKVKYVIRAIRAAYEAGQTAAATKGSSK